MRRAQILTFLALVISLILFCLNFERKPTMDKAFGFRLKEPMLISTDNNKPYYLIPANTILYHQRGFDEGHQLYTIEVLIKGNIEADRLKPSEAGEPIWLYPIEPDDLSKLQREYPVSKDDLIRILKARRVTKEDLAQIVRDWKD